jgi:hypothetical protein
MVCGYGTNGCGVSHLFALQSSTILILPAQARMVLTG